MVIKPSDIPKLNEWEQVEVKRMEKKIDKSLMKGDKIIPIDSISNNVVNSIIEKYKSAGWKVKKIYDDRDGDYLNFKS